MKRAGDTIPTAATSGHVPGGLAVELVNTRDRALAADVAELARRLAREFPAARGAQASVMLTDDDAITALNRRWRKRDRPTDVLSFPMGHRDPETGRVMLGEVCISRARARAQGREYGTGYRGELRRLVLHGLLHLLDLSHRAMDAVNRRYLGDD